MKELDVKRRDVMAARARLDDTVASLKARLEPRAVADSLATGASDYAQQASDRALRTLRARPGRLAAVAGALTLFLFRKPITRAITARRDKGDDHG